MQSDEPKRLSRSERYKRRIAGLNGQVREITDILNTVTPELPPERQQAVIAAMQRANIEVLMNTEKQFALTNAGAVLFEDGLPVITGFIPDAPGDHSSRFPKSSRWLPIESADSEPFDAATHYRLAPSYRLDGERVLRVYPIILKEQDGRAA